MTWTHNVVKDFWFDSTRRFDVMLRRPEYIWVAYDCVKPRRGEFDSVVDAKRWCEARSKL